MTDSNYKEFASSHSLKDRCWLLAQAESGTFSPSFRSLIPMLAAFAPVVAGGLDVALGDMSLHWGLNLGCTLRSRSVAGDMVLSSLQLACIFVYLLSINTIAFCFNLAVPRLSCSIWESLFRLVCYF